MREMTRAPPYAHEQEENFQNAAPLVAAKPSASSLNYSIQLCTDILLAGSSALVGTDSAGPGCMGCDGDSLPSDATL